MPAGDPTARAAMHVLRPASASIANGAARVPQPGGTPLAHLGLVTHPGSTRTYQVVHRNQAAFCASGATKATNGRVLTWTP